MFASSGEGDVAFHASVAITRENHASSLRKSPSGSLAGCMNATFRPGEAPGTKAILRAMTVSLLSGFSTSWLEPNGSLHWRSICEAAARA
jgi:hypothetical protein